MAAFDTLRAARRLRDEGGFDERQAEAMVDTFAEGMDETLATKADLEKTELVLRSEIKETEATLRGEIKETEATLRGEIGALRGDLEKTEATLRSEIKATEAVLRGEIKDIRSEMEGMEKRIVIRLGLMLVTAVGLIVALDKLV